MRIADSLAETALAETVTDAMDVLGTGLVLIVNGFVTLVAHLLSWPVLFSVISGSSLMYLASVEVSELDRISSKPIVERH